MHDIEPYWKWRDKYLAEDDENSPFYGKEYNEFQFTDTIYNFYIHPQWDQFGSTTLVLKILFVDYDEGFAIIELLGEWNDLLYNDIQAFKREIIDILIGYGISRFALIGENVLNYHPDDDSYYEEWLEDISEEGGWVAMINFQPHVEEEMKQANLHYYLQFNERLSDLAWRKLEAPKLIDLIETLLLPHLS